MVTRQFRRWGWVFVGALALFDAILINDLFLVAPGGHGIIARWHGAPWPLVLLLAAPFAHVWLVVLVWMRWVRSHESARGTANLVVALLLVIAVLHALLWDNGSWIKRVLA